MSDIKSKVRYRLLLRKIAPSKLSTPSAIFLPVQLRNSSESMLLIEKGGSYFLGSGSFDLMCSLNLSF